MKALDFGLAFYSILTGRPIRSPRRKLRILRRIRKEMEEDGELSGDVYDGVKVIARWRNPEDRAARSEEWKVTTQPGQDLPSFFETLGNVIEASNIEERYEQQIVEMQRAGDNRKRLSGGLKRGGRANNQRGSKRKPAAGNKGKNTKIQSGKRRVTKKKR